MFRRTLTLMVLCAVAVSVALADEPKLPLVLGADVQPLLVHTQRLGEAMEFLGVPLSKEAKAKFEAAAKLDNAGEALKLVQEALDPLCLMRVHINPESRVKVDAGPAAK